MNYEIHLGERIEYFIKNAPHGKGLSGFSKFIGRPKGSVYNMYNSEDLDFKVVLKACEYYGVSLAGFLGLEESELGDGGQISIRTPEPAELRMDRMEGKLDQILQLLNQK